MRMKRATFILALLLLCGADTAFACRYDGTSPIALNGFIARGYGQVSFLFAVGTIYLQLRRVGFNKATFFWAASFIPLYFLNPGWHYLGTSGDCGDGEKYGAHQMTFFIGAMLLWQIGATFCHIWRQRTVVQAAL